MATANGSGNQSSAITDTIGVSPKPESRGRAPIEHCAGRKRYRSGKRRVAYRRWFVIVGFVEFGVKYHVYCVCRQIPSFPYCARRNRVVLP